MFTHPRRLCLTLASALTIPLTAFAHGDAPPAGLRSVLQISAPPIVPCVLPEYEARGERRRVPRTWSFRVKIVSGSRTGQTWAGGFKVDPADIPARGDVTVTATSFRFSYGGKHFTEKDLGEPAQVRFVNGEPVDLMAVGGPNHLRFGFSAGFDRGQFGRSEEAFIPNGEPYFGYLDPDTYVDGAGRVSYSHGSTNVADR